jgi:hypothetical protein
MSSSKSVNNSSKKSVNKSNKKKVKVVEVETVEKLDRRGRPMLVTQPVKHRQPQGQQAKQETIAHNKQPQIRESLSPVAFGFEQGAKKPKLSKVCDSLFSHSSPMVNHNMLESK